MKRILLTSTAMVAFAGAAAADVSFSGKAKLGMNTYKGVYWSASLGVKAEQELSSGFTAGAKATLKLVPGANGLTSGGNISFSGYELYLKSETAGLYFGDTKTAAGAKWKAGVSGLSEDKFATKLSHYTYGAGVKESAILRGEASFSGFDVAVSGALISADGKGFTKKYEIEGMQVAAQYTTGDYKFRFAYQENTVGLIAKNAARGNRRVGVSATATFGGADVTLAHVRNLTTNNSSTGVAVSYPFGPVTVSGYYANNTAAANAYGVKLVYNQDAIKVTAGVKGKSKFGATAASNTVYLDGQYTMGNGIVLKAGGSTVTASGGARSAYIGGTYDLGGGATLLVSHGWDNNKTNNTAAGLNDDIGAASFNEGTTIEMSFKF